MSETPRLEIDAKNIAWITFDDPNSKVNVLNAAVMEKLANVIEQIAANAAVRAVVVIGKPDGFLAGADIKALQAIKTIAEGRELAARGQEIFSALEKIGENIPVVCAITGFALGGGCELALACSYRIASDNPKTQIGLPEVKLGIFPGWGGTQRLPRLIGLKAALDIILAGKSLNAKKAKEVGLVDEIAPDTMLRQRAEEVADNYAKFAPKREGHFVENHPPMRGVICAAARKETLEKTRGNYPAPLLALDAIEQGLGKDLRGGLEIEAKLFGEISVTTACKNLIRVFFLDGDYKKLRAFPKEKIEPLPVAKVGVVGAGLMGSGIAHWLASRGFTVRLKDVKPEFVQGGLKRISAIVDGGVKRGKLTAQDAEKIMARISPTTDYAGFESCDLIIEAVLEKEELKKTVFEEISAIAREDAILASNTSAIPISHIAANVKKPSRFLGIHFFNPVHMMPLVEVVVGKHSGKVAVESAVALVKKIGKTPVIVNESPGFLVNRLLLPYMNEAGFLLEEGNPIELIDKAATDFGMPMGPLRLTDEVGIAVTYEVCRELQEAFGDRMKISSVVVRVNATGLKGKSGGSGFYLYEGKSETPNAKIYDILNIKPAQQPLALQTIQQRLIYTMINEAARVLEEKVVATPNDVDAGMIFGTGFPPFRGGLMAYADSIGVPSIVKSLEEFAKTYGARFTPAPLLLDMAISGKKFVG
jgi:3-hydroxyacyl-CoA dehydrogenase/enoyl-CoA hydratase/3-hydroxybutyryl-CoA epimerase